MNKQIAKLGVGLLACYLALFATVNYVQIWRAEELSETTFPCFEVRPSQRDASTAPVVCSNTRNAFDGFNQARGEILSADGLVLARSDPLPEGSSSFTFQRVYPPETADLFAHTTGFTNFTFEDEGAERAFDADLSPEVEDTLGGGLFVEEQDPRDVTLTLDSRVQAVAREQLGDRRGSVVAIDPRDGSILAMWSFPSYDPNLLATNDQAAASTARTVLIPADDPETPQDEQQLSPLIPATFRRSFPPGSTFKVVTTSAGVEQGVVTPDEPNYAPATEFDIDFTDDGLSNFGGSRCGGTLFQILAASCNSAFADMGVNTIGEAGMVTGAESFGFNQRPPFDLPAPATSGFPTAFPDDQGNGPLARASIGQGDVQATPLQMALVAAAVANDGVLMAPHVLDRITDADGDVVRQAEGEVWQQPLSPGSAEVVQQAMIGVVQGGSGTAARIAGFVVGGKTGTAQVGSDPPSSHAWFISFAGPDGGPAEVAVAVLVEAQPGISEVTGGRVAAPIARAVMETVLNLPD